MKLNTVVSCAKVSTPKWFRSVRLYLEVQILMVILGMSTRGSWCHFQSFEIVLTLQSLCKHSATMGSSKQLCKSLKIKAVDAKWQRMATRRFQLAIKVLVSCDICQGRVLVSPERRVPNFCPCYYCFFRKIKNNYAFILAGMNCPFSPHPDMTVFTSFQSQKNH